MRLFGWFRTPDWDDESMPWPIEECGTIYLPCPFCKQRPRQPHLGSCRLSMMSTGEWLFVVALPPERVPR